MKIKTKLTAALLLIALIPLVVVSVVSYAVMRHSMAHQIRDQLDSLVSVQQRRVETVLLRDKERLSLFTSNAALLSNLQAFNRTADEHSRRNLSQILLLARSSVKTFKDIHVMNPQGVVVASTNRSAVGTDRSGAESFVEGRTGVSVDTFFRSKSGATLQYLTRPIKSGGQFLGVLAVESVPRDLVDITRDYSGLGATGETVLATRDVKGDAVFVTPLRFDKNASLERVVPQERKNIPIIQALSGKNTSLENAVDYRGKPVLASTRYIKDPGWGLVTKMDRSEAFSTVNSLGILFMGVAAAALAIIVLFSLILARRFTQPLTELTEAARAISDGDLSRRAKVTSNDEIGELAGAFNKMTVDLAEARGNLERKVEERTEELATANAELEGYAFTVSHDLKGPLSAAHLAEQILRDQLARPVEHQDKEVIRESSDIMERNLKKSFQLVDDLLTLAEAGQVPARVQSVDVSAVVQTVLNERQSALDETGTRVTAAADLGQVEGDQTQLYQVFTNLIGNSLKHNTSSVPTMDVSYLGKGEDGAHHYLVRDNGPGIPPESVDRLFEAFFKGDTGETGIGLATVKKIIRVYGGEIRAYNDGGACFEFTIRDLDDK
jgi:signal transduction histidine kinase